MDKVKKIIYIISGSLSIMLMVFLLMHKVGLCASSGSSGDGIIYLDEFYPMPVGDYIGYETDIPIRDIVEQIYSQDSWSGRVLILTYEEDINNYIEFDVIKLDTSSYGITTRDYNDCEFLFYAESISSGGYYFKNYRYSFSDGSIVETGRTGYGVTVYARSLVDESPANAPYLVYKGDFISHYPVGVFIDGVHTNVLLNRRDELYFTYSEMVVESGWNDVEFSDYSDLPDSPSSGDTDYNLYQWLNGQNKSNYDYTKSIFDLLKGFFSWVVAAPDSNVIQGAWNDTDLGGVVNYVSGLGDTLKSLLGNGAQAPETLSFNCSITLLNHTFPYTVDFSWYQQIKTQFLTVFLTFFYVGAFLYFIKSIPSFINGVSGTMNNFTQAGGGSDD